MQANEVIRFLRSGIVPVGEVRALSGGYGKLDSTIIKHLAAFCSGENPDPLFVHGEWGTGKSHFLAYAQSVAIRKGVPVIELALNSRTTALNHPQRLYSQVASGMRFGECLGLRDFLLTSAQKLELRTKLLGAVAKSESPLATAIKTICQHFVGSAQHVSSMSDSWAWTVILGLDIAWADYAYMKERALDRLDELSAIFRRLGRGGFAVLLDELETIDQLWNRRSRFCAYEVLGRLCRSGNILPIFAITERFNRVVDSDIENGALGSFAISSNAKWFLQGWKRREWAQLAPPRFSNESASDVIDKISTVYFEAYKSPRLSPAQKAECIEVWGKNPGRNPRQLIRLTVDALDRLRPFA